MDYFEGMSIRIGESASETGPDDENTEIYESEYEGENDYEDDYEDEHEDEHEHGYGHRHGDIISSSNDQTGPQSLKIKKKKKSKRKSKHGKKKLSDQIFNQMVKDTEELDRLLEVSARLREEHTRKQKDALLNFEDELLQIGDLSTIEEYFSKKEYDSTRVIDHNLNRLMSATGKSSSGKYGLHGIGIGDNDDKDGDYENEQFEDQLSPSDKARSSLLSRGMQSNLLRKQDIPQPSFEMKGNIRLKIIDLLDSSRSKEDQLEDALVTARQENPYQCEVIAEELYQIQKENVERLTQLIREYRPVGGKVWGDNPDHAAFTQRLRHALLLEDPMGSETRNNLSTASTNKTIRSRRR